ncbi:MAG: restriction endonuclease [Firmicutes bacterium]|nr:restriction endonuclease [Bacillota bacterium]
MNKPQLIEFGLTDNSLEIYESQIKKYNEISDYIFKEKQKHNKSVVKACVIPSLFFVPITFILWGRLNNYGEGSSLFVFFMLVATIAYPIIIKKLFFIELYALTDFEKRKKKQFEKNLNCKNKDDIVDKNLEKKIHEFNSAIETYKNATDKSRPTYWKLLTHRQFEIEVANLYSLLGYSTVVTKATGDGGIDVVINKDGKKTGIQCKQHSNPVGPNDFRALIGVIASQDYDHGILVSLNGFTSAVLDEARKSRIRVELISCSDLVSLAKNIK